MSFFIIPPQVRSSQSSSCCSELSFGEDSNKNHSYQHIASFLKRKLSNPGQPVKPQGIHQSSCPKQSPNDRNEYIFDISDQSALSGQNSPMTMTPGNSSDSESLQGSEEESPSGDKPGKLRRISKKQLLLAKKLQNKKSLHGLQSESMQLENEFSLGPSSSGATTASSRSEEEEKEELFSEDSLYQEPLLTKRFKKDNSCSNISSNSCSRKNSLLSNSSDTMSWSSKVNNGNESLSSDAMTPDFQPIDSVAAKQHIQQLDSSIFRLDNNIPSNKNKDNNRKNRRYPSESQPDFKFSCSQQQQENEENKNSKLRQEEARLLVGQRMGRLAAEPINGFPCCTFSIRCFLKHSFFLTLEELKAGVWCNQCQQHLHRAQNFAAENNGQLLSSFFSKTLTFQCANNHQWQSSHLNYAHSWCQACNRLIKDHFKQYIKEEEVRNQAEYEKSQQEIYKQARQRAMNQQNSCGDSDDYKKKVISAAQLVEKEVEKIAESQANEYIRDHQEGSEEPCSLGQLKEMFKMLLFPESILQVYYLNMDADCLKNQYRSIARLIHPDKNFHPRAAESFQKLNHIYNLSLPKSNN